MRGAARRAVALRALAPLLLVLALGSGAGCGGSLDPRGDFLQSVRRYHEDLRWARYNDATLTLAPALRKAFLTRARLAEDKLAIGEYELFSADIEPKGRDRATVQVKITWNHRDETIVRTTMLEQIWRRKRDAWYIVAEKRLKGSPFPLELPGRADSRESVPSSSNPSGTVPITRQNNAN